MVKTLRTFATFFELLKYLTVLFSACYLFGWIVQFFSRDLYERFDELFGFLGKYIDDLYLIQYQITGIDVTMGYVIAALILVVGTLIFNGIESKIKKIILQIDLEETTKKVEQKYAPQEVKPIKKEIVKVNFKYYFGMLDFKLEHAYEHIQAQVNLDELKKQYLSMLKKKLESRYSNIKIAHSDKIFMSSEDFSTFDLVLCDIVEMFEIFQELDNKKHIKTHLLLAFEAAKKDVDVQFMIKFLRKLLQLNHYNKIIVADNFAQQYKQKTEKHFQIIPFGLIKLEISDSEDIDVETYYLKRK